MSLARTARDDGDLVEHGLEDIGRLESFSIAGISCVMTIIGSVSNTENEHFL